MVGIFSYDVKIAPSSATLGVAMTASALTVSLVRTDIGVDVQPASGAVLSGILTLGMTSAVGAIIKAQLADRLPGAVAGCFPVTHRFDAPLGFQIDLGDLGVTIAVTVSSLELGTYQGMLLASGAVQVA